MKQTGKSVQTIDEADNQTDVNNNVTDCNMALMLRSLKEA